MSVQYFGFRLFRSFRVEGFWSQRLPGFSFRVGGFAHLVACVCLCVCVLSRQALQVGGSSFGSPEFQGVST